MTLRWPESARATTPDGHHTVTFEGLVTTLRSVGGGFGGDGLLLGERWVWVCRLDHFYRVSTWTNGRVGRLCVDCATAEDAVLAFGQEAGLADLAETLFGWLQGARR